VSVLVNDHSASSMVELPQARPSLTGLRAVPSVGPQQATDQQWFDDYGL